MPKFILEVDEILLTKRTDDVYCLESKEIIVGRKSATVKRLRRLLSNARDPNDKSRINNFKITRLNN